MARGATSGGTGDGAADVAAELAALRLSVERLSQQVQEVLETQATHSEMLQRIEEAAAAPVAPEHALADTLAQIAAILGEQTHRLRAIEAVMAQLPADVGVAVGQAVRDGLADV